MECNALDHKIRVDLSIIWVMPFRNGLFLSTLCIDVDLFIRPCAEIVLKMSSIAVLDTMAKLTGSWASCQIRKIAGCAGAGNAGSVLPAIAGYWFRHASRHVRDARAVMHAGITN